MQLLLLFTLMLATLTALGQQQMEAQNIHVEDKMKALFSREYVPQATPTIVPPTNINLRAFPNPANSDFTVSFQREEQHDYALEFYNMVGKKVWTKTHITDHQITIERTRFDPGHYFFYLLQNNATVAMGKIIIE